MPMKTIFRSVTVDTKSDIPLSLQLMQQLVWLLATRQLRTGDELPSVREFANHLGINLNTVRAAYKRLESDALVATRKGVGSTVLPFDSRKITELATNLRTFTIGVVIPALSSLFYLPFLEGIEEIARKEPSLLFISTAQDSLLKARIEMDQLIAKGVDGLIIASFRAMGEDSQQLNGPSDSIPPIVHVDRPSQSAYVVLMDSESAGYQATSHLIEHGHERIGIIRPPIEWASVEECANGYRRALKMAGIEVDESLYAETLDFTVKAGFQAARTLIRKENAPTAIFAVSDILAIGAMRAVKEHGMLVPQDVGIVGYNDIMVANLVDPPLTTVAAPARRLGIEAMSMLQRLIHGDAVSPNRIVLDTNLVIRRSCGCHGDEGLKAGNE